MSIIIIDEYDRIVNNLNLLTLDNNDYHNDYSPLWAALTSNTHLRSVIRDIHQMMDPFSSTTPILLNRTSVLDTASESLQRQFLEEISDNIPSVDTNPSHPTRIIWRSKTKNAVNKSCLPEAAKSEINKALHSDHDTDQSNEQDFILVSSPLNNYARQNGHSNYNQLVKIFKLNLENEGERRGRMKKSFTCQLSPPDLAEIATWQPQILLAESTSCYKKLLLQFLKSGSEFFDSDSTSVLTANSPSTSASTFASASASASASSAFSARAISIFKNCLSVASALLQNQAPTLSLNKLASINQMQIRFPPRRVVDKALRVRDLSNLEQPVTFTCYWCDPFAKRDDAMTLHESLSSFKKELGDVNVYRLHCYYTEQA